MEGNSIAELAKAIGGVRPHPDVDEWLQSHDIAIPYFDDAMLRFVFDGLEDDDGPEDFFRAVSSFLSLQAVDRFEAAPYLRALALSVMGQIGMERFEFDLTRPHEVWEHVRPDEIFVTRRSGDGKVYVQCCLKVDWDGEHEYQIVLRSGKELSYVSIYDGHLSYCDAYGKPEAEDRICNCDLDGTFDEEA